MTIIAYRSSVMCSDSWVVSEDHMIHTRPKIVRMRNGGLCGAAGDCSAADQLLHWAEGSRRSKFCPHVTERDSYDGLLVEPDGTMFRCEAGRMYRVEGPYAAIGSGAAVALGALHAGADAVMACAAAIKHTLSCGGDIICERIRT